MLQFIYSDIATKKILLFLPEVQHFLLAQQICPWVCHHTFSQHGYVQWFGEAPDLLWTNIQNKVMIQSDLIIGQLPVYYKSQFGFGPFTFEIFLVVKFLVFQNVNCLFRHKYIYIYIYIPKTVWVFIQYMKWNQTWKNRNILKVSFNNSNVRILITVCTLFCFSQMKIDHLSKSKKFISCFNLNINQMKTINNFLNWRR